MEPASGELRSSGSRNEPKLHAAGATKSSVFLRLQSGPAISAPQSTTQPISVQSHSSSDTSHHPPMPETADDHGTAPNDHYARDNSNSMAGHRLTRPPDADAPPEANQGIGRRKGRAQKGMASDAILAAQGTLAHPRALRHTPEPARPPAQPLSAKQLCQIISHRPSSSPSGSQRPAARMGHDAHSAPIPASKAPAGRVPLSQSNSTPRILVRPALANGHVPTGHKAFSGMHCDRVSTAEPSAGAYVLGASPLSTSHMRSDFISSHSGAQNQAQPSSRMPTKIMSRAASQPVTRQPTSQPDNALAASQAADIQQRIPNVTNSTPRRQVKSRGILREPTPDLDDRQGHERDADHGADVASEPGKQQPLPRLDARWGTPSHRLQSVVIPTEQSAVGGLSDGDDSSTGSRTAGMSRMSHKLHGPAKGVALQGLASQDGSYGSVRMVRRGNLQLIRQADCHPASRPNRVHADSPAGDPVAASTAGLANGKPSISGQAGGLQEARSSVFSRLQDGVGGVPPGQNVQSISQGRPASQSVMSRLSGRKRQPEEPQSVAYALEPPAPKRSIFSRIG